MKYDKKTNFEKLNDLLQKIESIKEKYDKKREKELFNIFSALYRIDDEVRLHSRFISYLLSSKSNHKKGNLFAKIFIEKILGIENFDFKNYEVYPNEFNKSEYKEIDILLVDKNKKGIIIENKTRYGTPDSNYNDKREGYNGQLERYYNTIHQGKDVNGSHSIHCENPFVFYLSPNGKLPNEISLGDELTLDKKIKDKIYVQCIHYESDIIKWLEQCIDKIKSDEVLKGIVKQYIKIVKVMTDTDISIEERKKLKDEIAKNYKNVMYLQNNFKHIKWHTVDDFWTILGGKLKGKIETDNGKEITKITHYQRSGCLKITFNEKMYVCYDDKGLTFGVIGADPWFKSEKSREIDFVNFSNEKTFSLIDKNRMEIIVDEIFNEIEEKLNKSAL